MRSGLLFEIEAELAEIVSIGDTGTGERRMIGISGGRFAGPELSGRILPGGADWQLVRGDGITEIEARYLLETDDGVRLQVRSDGVRHGPAEVMAALARGEAVDPARYYFRTCMRFEASGRLAWLNGVLAVAAGERRARAVRLVVQRVL